MSDENRDLELLLHCCDYELQVDSYQETVERWKRRAGALSKQCTDLSTVMRKYITGTNSRGQYLFLNHDHNEQTCSHTQIHHGNHETFHFPEPAVLIPLP